MDMHFPLFKKKYSRWHYKKLQDLWKRSNNVPSVLLRNKGNTLQRRVSNSQVLFWCKMLKPSWQHHADSALITVEEEPVSGLSWPKIKIKKCWHTLPSNTPNVYGNTSTAHDLTPMCHCWDTGLLLPWHQWIIDVKFVCHQCDVEGASHHFQ